MDVCAVFHVVLSRKKKGEERVGVGGRGKYPGAPPHKGKKRKKPTARYLIDQYGEKGKAKKKNITKLFLLTFLYLDFVYRQLKRYLTIDTLQKKNQKFDTDSAGV
jgi:hypothetical protein